MENWFMCSSFCSLTAHFPEVNRSHCAVVNINSSALKYSLQYSVFLVFIFTLNVHKAWK